MKGGSACLHVCKYVCDCLLLELVCCMVDMN